MISPWYLPARPSIILPSRRVLEIPSRRPIVRPVLAVPTLVQSNQSAYDGGALVDVTLGAALTPGNLLMAIKTGADGAGTPATTISCGGGRNLTNLGVFQAHTNGGIMQLAYRFVQPGDSNVISYPLGGGNVGIGAAEFSGLSGVLGGSATAPTLTGGPVMSLTVAPGVGWLAVMGMATRANSNVAGFTANAASTRLALNGVIHSGLSDYDNAMWCYGVVGASGSITTGGTATGGSRNAGSPWSGIVQAFAPSVSLSFVGEPGGGVW